MEASEAAKNALACVLGAKKDEHLAVFCDHEKLPIGNAFAAGAIKLGLKTRLVPLETHENKFREEIPRELTDIIEKDTPDIYVNLLRGIREETPFRIKLIKLETKDHKARLGHCPGVTLDMLTKGAMALTEQDHQKMQGFAHSLMRRLGNVEKLEVSNPSGTKLTIGVSGRPFYTDTIIDWKTLKWMNLPTGEVIVAPVENSMEGSLICDMAIGGIGPLHANVELSVAKGKVKNVSSHDEKVLRQVKDSLNTDDWSSTVGEFAFGINPKARFVDEFLEAEKILGTTHIAFGDNTDMPGGKNSSKNHMDLLISKPTVKAVSSSGSSINVLAEGVFQKA